MTEEEIGKTVNECIGRSGEYHYPRWEDFPDVDLYMDQVIELVNGYMSGLSDVLGDDALITPSMINNYVKSKTMSPPVKKRYSRSHIAYIIMICTLKQTFSMSEIQTLIEDDDVKGLYNAFAEAQEEAYKNAVASIESELEKGKDNRLLLKLASGVNIRKSLISRFVTE